MRLIPLLLITLLSAGLNALTPGQGQPLSPQDCLKLAMENHPEISAARKELDAARAEFRSTDHLAYPQLSLALNTLWRQEALTLDTPGGYLPTFNPSLTGALTPNLLLDPQTGAPLTDGEGKPIFAQYAFFPDQHLEVFPKSLALTTLQVTQPILTGGKLQAARNSRRLAIEAAQAQAERASRALREEVDTAFWTTWVLQEQEQALLARQKSLQILSERLEHALAEGMVTRDKVLAARVALGQVDLHLLQLRHQCNLSRQNLNRLLGRPFDAPLVLHPPQDPEQDEIRAMTTLEADPDHWPELVLLSLSGKAEWEKARMDSSDTRPTLTLMAMLNHTRYTLNQDRKRETDFAALASLQIPLFTWNRGRDQLRAGHARQEAIQERQRDLESRLTLRLHQHRSDLLEAIDQMALARANFARTKEQARVSENQFKEGLMTLSDHLDHLADVQEAQDQVSTARAGLHLAISRLMLSLGR